MRAAALVSHAVAAVLLSTLFLSLSNPATAAPCPTKAAAAQTLADLAHTSGDGR